MLRSPYLPRSRCGQGPCRRPTRRFLPSFSDRCGRGGSRGLTRSTGICASRPIFVYRFVSMALERASSGGSALRLPPSSRFICPVQCIGSLASHMKAAERCGSASPAYRDSLHPSSLADWPEALTSGWKMTTVERKKKSGTRIYSSLERGYEWEDDRYDMLRFGIRFSLRISII